MNIYLIHQSNKDNYYNHQLVKELFPGKNKVLFQNKGNKLLVLSETLVDDKFKDELMIEFIGTTNDKLNNIKDDEFCFSIRLNSCKRHKCKRVTIPEDSVNDWVDNKLKNLGGEIISKVIKNEGIIRSKRNNIFCYHASVLVVGIMKVIDHDLLSNNIHNGIGHGKSFGFGLLNVFD